MHLDQTKVGRLSRMDAMQQQSMAQSTMRTIEKRLKLIAAALRRLDEGEYGYCEACDEDITPERLNIQPEAPFCISCQSKIEG